MSMLRVALVALSIAFVCAPPAEAQGPPSASPGAGQWELAVLGGAGEMWPGFHLEGPHRFQSLMLQLGKVVSRRRGSPPLAGNLEVVLELIPLFRMSQSRPASGVGVMPVSMRWNFGRTRGVQPFLELISGVLITNEAVPEGTARFNFVAAAGPGVRLWLSERRAVLLGYRFHHISNGNRLESNPGINSNFFYLGLSILR